MIKAMEMRQARHVVLMREKRNAHRTLVGKPEGKRKEKDKLRDKHRWKDNMNIYNSGLWG
jgi:hypothetical protein